MVYRGKDQSNSALLYMDEIKTQEGNLNWYNGITCTANNDEDLTYCFMIRGGEMIAFEAYSRPKMNVIPRDNYTLPEGKSETIPIKVAVKNIWSVQSTAEAEKHIITLNISLININNEVKIKPEGTVIDPKLTTPLPSANKSTTFQIKYSDFFTGNILETTLSTEDPNDYGKNILFRDRISKEGSTFMYEGLQVEDFEPFVDGVLILTKD